ncbi:hypothetical protein V6N13_071104 [Hibiscus sabdariffa]
MATIDWRKLFSSGGDEQTLNFFPPVTRDDSIEIDPPSKVFNEGISDWKLSLVGQFIGAAPNFMALRRIVASLWGKYALTRVSLAGSNLYVFSFSNATARDWVLENGLWHIQHKPLILRKWEPNLQRLEFAKVCIEVPAGVRLPRTIPVKMRDKSVVTIKVKLPWMPASCSSCKTFGHSEKLCSEFKAGNVQAKGVDGVVVVDGVPSPGIDLIDPVEFNGVRASSSKSDGCLVAEVDDVGETGQELSIGSIPVAVGDVIGSSMRMLNEDFPLLQRPKVKGRGKGRGRNLKNKFEAL